MQVDRIWYRRRFGGKYQWIRGSMGVDVLIPQTADGAVEAFGDGSDITVIGGGTIVMQLLNYRRIKPTKALLLNKAGLSYVRMEGSSYTVGAMTPLSDLIDLFSPLGPCARNVADREVQFQATIGGNLCAPTPPEHPSGDLQAPLIALGATVRSVGAGGERTESVEDFLGNKTGRLVLDISFDTPNAGAFAALDRPHTRHFTALAVSGAKTEDGVRLAATGVGPVGVRLRSAEALADDPAAAGAAALEDSTMRDDALASAWYRGRTLPALVARVLNEIKEAS
jgi:carbon-monoxide dehydrogenase medium subunit